VRLPGKGNSNSRGARPVYLIITMVQWFWTSRLSIKNSLSQIPEIAPTTLRGTSHRLSEDGSVQFSISEQLLYRNVQRFRGGLVFKAHRLVYHSTIGWRLIQKKKKKVPESTLEDV